MLVDSHCHLNMLDTEKRSVADYIDAATENGVSHLLTVSTVPEDFAQLITLAETYANVTCSIGVHPNEMPELTVSEEELVTAARHPRVVAIGETGLDYYRSEGDLSWQQQRFRCHIAAAKTLQKPLIVHTRQAREDTLTILREEHASEVGGVLHCFTEDWQMAKQALDIGFYISFSGIVTFKNATELQQVAKQVPADRFLIETDCPFLAPVPKRGKPNEPAYVRYVAEFLAELRGTDFATIAQQSHDNFYRLFAEQSQ